jgi:hypothetical protein
MRSVNVALPDDLADKLLTLAERERRTPRMQAAVVLIDALRRVDIAPELRSDERAALAPNQTDR